MPTPLSGAFIVDLERQQDERGFFARSFCSGELAANGLASAFSQCSVSFNAAKGTLRGLHFQISPHDEEKLVRCTAGRIFDVIVDIREDSVSYRRWYGSELTADNRRALYIPKGFAHGFLTLTHAAEVFYMMSVPFAPGFGRGLRWNDPALGIEWPVEPAVISARDAAYPLLETRR